MKPTILVTGGTGYIGSHTVVELQKAGYPVVIIDNLSNSSRDVLDGIERITGIRPEFVEADCTDITALKILFDTYPGIKGIINFAASKAVGESMEKPLLYYRNNLNTLMNLLDMMGRYDVDGIVFSSSCTVYGEPDHNPVTEQTPSRRPPRLTATQSRFPRKSSPIPSTRAHPSRPCCCVISTPWALTPRLKSASCPTACPRTLCPTSPRQPWAYARN